MTHVILLKKHDSVGGGVTFGFPIGETQRINFERTSNIRDHEGFAAAQEISEFIDRNGPNALNFKANLSWIRSTLNRGVFADRGSSQSIGATISAGSDLEFYRLTYQGEKYFPDQCFTQTSDRTCLAVAMATHHRCRFTNTFAGGFGSIRGLKLDAGTTQHTAPGCRGQPIIFNSFGRDGDMDSLWR